VLNAVYFIPSVLNSKRKHTALLNETAQLKDAFSILRTFSLIAISLVFFRSESLPLAMSFFSNLFQSSLFSVPEILPWFSLVTLFLFIVLEWNGRTDKYAIQNLLATSPKYIRVGIYYVFIAFIYYSAGTPKDYIYFQF
jgi:hypothetical protein